MLLINFSFLLITVFNTSLLESKIVGGYPVDKGDMRYIVSLQIFNMHVFGGSLISIKLELTAAQCIYIIYKRGGSNWNNATVFAPIDQSLRAGSKYFIQFAMLSPKFDPNDPLNTSNYDIGVIMVCIPFYS